MSREEIKLNEGTDRDELLKQIDELKQGQSEMMELLKRVLGGEKT